MVKIFLLLLFSALYYTSLGQDFGVLVKLKPDANFTNGLINENEKIATINQKYRTDGFKEYYPNAKNPELKQYYFISGNGNKQGLFKELINLELFESIEERDTFYTSNCTSPEPPVNDTWIAQQWANNYALEMIEANCAWSISKGNSNIHIGIADTDFELTHDDLEDQIVSISGSITAGHQHGTAVAGCASAETNNNLGIAGIGYNSKIAAHRISHTIDGYGNAGASSDAIKSAIWNLYQDGIPIINVSWTGTGLNYDAAEEITENGTILVLGAGNSPDIVNHSLIANIPGVIVVSSVNEDNEHDPTGHAHNQYVDICAPGTNVTTTKYSNTYGGAWGTSFATPLVSGTIALMLEVNPCLTPAEIELLIEDSADPVADAQNFPGLLGAGRLNAYEAVMAAGTRNFNNHTFTGNQNLTAGFGFNLDNSLIGNNSNINLTARKEVNITGTFNVPVGSTFSIEMDSNIQTNCQ